MGHKTPTENALSEDWLGRTDRTLAYYRQVRDMHAGKPLYAKTSGAARTLSPW